MSAFTQIKTGYRSDPTTWATGTPTATQPVNGGFEAPVLSTDAQTNDWTGATWTAVGATVLLINGTGFGNPGAYSGNQYCQFYQQGTLSQSFSWTADTYFLGFFARANGGVPVGQTLSIQIDGVEVTQVTPLITTAWEFFYISLGAISAGTHELKFESLVAGKGVFIDAVALYDAAGAPTALPGIGDTVTGTGGMTLKENGDWVIGTSPSDDTTMVLSLNGNLLLEADSSITVRGNGYNVGSVTMGEGSVLEFDASHAGTPATKYYWNKGGVTSPATGAGWYINGTADNPCIVRSNAGGGNAFVSKTDGFNQGDWECHHCTFLRVGDDANIALSSNGNTSGTFIFDDCTFDACGDIKNVLGTLSSANYSIYNCKWRNSLGSQNLNQQLGAGTVSGTHRIVECSFDGFPVFNNLTDFEFHDLTFLNGFGWFNGEPVSCYNIFCRISYNPPTAFVGPTVRGSVSRIYLFADSLVVDNCHILNVPSDIDTTVEECIFDFVGTLTTDACDSVLAPAGTETVIVRRCIALPNYTSGPTGGAMTLVNVGNITLCGADHCTTFVGYYGAVFQGDFTQTVPGIYAYYKNSIAWVPNDFDVAPGANTYHATSSRHSDDPSLDPQDIVNPAGLLNNYGWNLKPGYATRGFNVNLSTAPDSSNVVVTGTTGPAFVDSSRGFITWAVYNGATGTTQQKIDFGLALLIADPTRVDELIDFTFFGFNVQNNALKDAGTDGETIGAGIWVAAVPYNTVRPTVTGTAQVGQTLTGHHGTYTTAPDSYVYLWKHSDGSAADNTATNITYVVGFDDVGFEMIFTETPTNGTGDGPVAVSLPTDTVPAGQADFSGTPLSGATPLSVDFTYTGTPGTNTYQWDYSLDGGSYLPFDDDTAEDPTQVFTDAGLYTIRLETGGDVIDTVIKTDYITVTSPPPPPSTAVDQSRLFLGIGIGL